MHQAAPDPCIEKTLPGKPAVPLMSNVSRQRIRLLAFAALALAVALAMAAEVASWVNATSKQQSTGRVVVFRYAKGFREGFARINFPDRIILVWTYQSESGQAS